jgi:hypothetical protein
MRGILSPPLRRIRPFDREETNRLGRVDGVSLALPPAAAQRRPEPPPRSSRAGQHAARPHPIGTPADDGEDESDPRLPDLERRFPRGNALDLDLSRSGHCFAGSVASVNNQAVPSMQRMSKAVALSPLSFRSMRGPLVVILLGFWLFMAYRAFQRGDLVYAGVLVVVGIALTAWRVGVGRRRA